MNELEEPNPGEVDSITEVGKYPSLAKAQEHGLVVLAMSEPCWVEDADPAGQYALHATTESAPRVSKELELYADEQAEAQAPPVAHRDFFRHSMGWGAYTIWAVALVAVFLLQLTHPSLTDAWASSSTGLLARGEWWRPFTGLFLHADVQHLLGNLLSGMLFGTLVARSIGSIGGWLLILASGTIANLITSLVTWPESFVSIGASSAVFGALGILTGLGFSHMLRFRTRLPWARTAAPVIAGVILLGWMGGGSPGGNTDVLGHVFGFGSGLAAGLVVGHYSAKA